ncbi:MAG: LacI family DNA-binding transcriptional regulator [Victivallales bacterium]|nr:LacI family DNA-binding transcriptional regulator [Victivallales bacterium]
MATLKQIAGEVNASIAAVSYVMNGREGEVGSRMREKIRKALIRHDYHKNAIIQGLRDKNMRLIAAVLPSVRHSFFVRVLDGIETVASERGYLVILAQTMSDYRRFEFLMRRLQEFRASGLIITIPRMPVKLMKDTCSIRTPILCVDNSYVNHGIASVRNDDITGSIGAVGRLIALGHRRIGTMKIPSGIASEKFQGRFLGYKKALKDAGIPYRSELVGNAGSSSMEDGFEVGRELLDKGSGMTAFFAPSDTAAIGFANAAKEKGLLIPDDIALVGYANLREGICHDPPICTVEQHPEEIGSIAARYMIDWIEKKVVPQKLTLVPVDFIERKSIGGHVNEKEKNQAGRNGCAEKMFHPID